MQDTSVDDLDSLASHYLAVIDALAPDTGRVTDKLPHNFMHIGLIASLFPDARIIHCTRHPLDVCLSCYFQLFAVGNEYSFSLTDLAVHYRQYHELMQFWKKNTDIGILDINYETLIADPEHTIKQLLEFCRLDWDESCLHFHESGRQTRTASYDQTRQPLHTSSSGRWKNYRKHIKELTDALIDITGPV